MEEVVIVGAGVAGLCCMNALLDLGLQPLLIEGGAIGTQKLCGEFLSLEALSQLKAWNIGPIQDICDIHLFSKSAHLAVHVQAGAMSRSDAELQLAKRARSLGGRIIENKKIEKLLPGELIFADGTRLQSKQLVIATGRFANAPKDFPYMGLKAHFLHEAYTPHLEMNLFKGGYFGIVPISPATSNIACLVKAECYNQAFIEMNKELAWLTSPVGAFGLKKPPHLPNTYWIGDAIASFPPAAGAGFGHAIHSSLQAAKHILKSDPVGYRQSLERRLKPAMRWAMLLHRTMLSPTASHIAIGLLQKSPKTVNQLLHTIGLR